MPLLSTISPIQVARCTETPQKDRDKAEKAGETPLVPPMNSVVPTQVEGCIVMPQKAWAEAEEDGKSFSVPLMSIAPPIQVARCTATPLKDYVEAKKAGESLPASATSVVTPAQVVHCPTKPRKVYSDAEKDKEILSVSQRSIEFLEKVSHCLQKPQKIVESVICDGICVFGFKLMNGGSVLTILWLLNFIPLPRLISPSCFDLLMGLARVGIMDLGEMDGEERQWFKQILLAYQGSPFQWQMQWFYQWVSVRFLVLWQILSLCSSEDYCSNWVGYFGRIGGGR